MSIINMIGPDGETIQVESNDGEQAHGVDESGASLGLVPLGSAYAITPQPPAGSGWLWHFQLQQWVHTQTLPDAIAGAHADIDTAAGSARLRYITDVAGQQATYITKAAESQTYLDEGGTPGAYLLGESEALGVTATEAAEYILLTSSLWGDVVGPEIEKARRVGKLDVSSAVSLSEVNEKRALAMAALAQI